MAFQEILLYKASPEVKRFLGKQYRRGIRCMNSRINFAKDVICNFEF